MSGTRQRIGRLRPMGGFAGGFVLCFVLCVLLQACASAPSTLYDWKDYPDRTHDYLRSHGYASDSGNANDALKAMQHELTDFQDGRLRAPPGYYAHLGLLYARQGDLAHYTQALESEKTLFPESAPFIDYLLNNTSPGLN